MVCTWVGVVEGGSGCVRACASECVCEWVLPRVCVYLCVCLCVCVLEGGGGGACEWVCEVCVRGRGIHVSKSLCGPKDVKGKTLPSLHRNRSLSPYSPMTQCPKPQCCYFLAFGYSSPALPSQHASLPQVTCLLSWSKHLQCKDSSIISCGSLKQNTWNYRYFNYKRYNIRLLFSCIV